MNLYIDTNIYLTFYHLTNDDLDELKKLAILIEDSQINLILPQQTRNEFVRNRDKTIFDAIASLKEQKISSRYPQISKGYDEYILLQDAYKNFEKQKNKIISKIETDAKDFNLNADVLTKRIFNSAKKVEITTELIEKSKTRYDLGNPPGKGKSYGDALNWESLLESVEYGEDLHLISDDGDFASLLDKKELNLYLKDEWEKKKNSIIYFYKTLSEFFKSKFPDIELSDQLEKEILIKSLATSASFSSAKSKLAKLSKYREFTSQQLNDIVEIAISNNQLYWISNDFGVGDVLINIIQGNEEKITPESLIEFNRIYRPEVQNEEQDLPF
ncbi:MAG: hypothetical protein E6Q45_01460 [Flavobacterium sp.]|nr:MAG: hypothetical protein E6Q45_01460 [Flavobacterium sp.]